MDAEHIEKQLDRIQQQLHALTEKAPLLQKYGNVKQLAALYGMSAKSVKDGIRAAMADGKKIRCIAAPTGERKLPRYYIDDVTRAFTI